MSPLESNGSVIIYNKYVFDIIIIYIVINNIIRIILPLYKKHSPGIDKAIEKAGSKAGDLFDKAMEKAKDYAAEQQLKKD